MKTLRFPLVLLFLSIFVSCSPKKIVSDLTNRNDLFPVGTYKHSVRIEFLSGEKREIRNMAFKGVFQRTRDHIRVVALTPFGTTAFRIVDDLKKGEVEYAIYLDRFKKFEPKLRTFYETLKPLFVATKTGATIPSTVRWTELTPGGWPRRGEMRLEESRVVLEMKEYDDHNIPELVVLQHPKFRLEIEVKGFEI